MRLSLLTAAATTLVFSTSAWAGVVFEIETKDHTDNTSDTLNMYVEGCSLKMDITTVSYSGTTSATVEARAGADVFVTRSGQIQTTHEGMIYKCEPEGITFIDHGRRMHFSPSTSSMGAGPDMNQIMKDAFKNGDPNQQAMISGMLEQLGMAKRAGDAPEPEKRLVNLHRTEFKNGYNTHVYEVFKGSELVERIYATDTSNIVGGDDMLRVMTRFSGYMTKQRAGMGDKDGEDGDWFDQLADLDGRFPVGAEEYEDGQLTGEYKLRGSKYQTFGDDAFDVPTGYILRTMMPGG